MSAPNTLLWAQVCQNVGDEAPGAPKGYVWYASMSRAGSNKGDMQAAFDDAALGNERAQRYVAEFMRLRMTT